MALRDAACYSLTLRTRDAHVLELVEANSAGQPGKGEVRYVRVREDRDGEVCSAVLYGELDG